MPIMTHTVTKTIQTYIAPAASRAPSTLPPSPPHRLPPMPSQKQSQKPPARHYSKSVSYSPEANSLDSVRSSLASDDVVIGDRWLVLSKIDQGSFGEVFEARDTETRRLYAIKREPLHARFPQLKHESNMYNVLAGGPGIPQCHWHGPHGDFDCIVIDLLGTSLQHIRDTVDVIPLATIIDFGCQMVDMFEHIHHRGLLYRDVKPENFLFGAHCQLPETREMTCDEVFSLWGEHSRAPKLYIVDFGLATWWRNPYTNRPYPQSKKPIRNKTGTALYASLNVHRGKTHARRDDIESLGYMLLYLIRGNLPWEGIQARNTKAGWDRIREIKEHTSLEDLCAGVPPGFREFIEHARHLRFSDQPDYDHLRRMLRGRCSPSVSCTTYQSQMHHRQYHNGGTSVGAGADAGASVGVGAGTGGARTSTHPSQRHRRSSFSNSATQRVREEGVFDMDDLFQELSQVSTTQNTRRRARGNRKGHIRPLPHPQHSPHPQTPQSQFTPPSPPTHQKAPLESSRRRGSIGSTHRRWVPKWVTDGNNKPDNQWARW